MPATQEQRLSALELANAVRSEKSQIRKDLKSGKLRIDVLLRTLPECIRKVAVAEVLSWCPGVGVQRRRVSTKIPRIMQGVVLDGGMPIGKLPDRHRAVLGARALRYQLTRILGPEA